MREEGSRAVYCNETGGERLARGRRLGIGGRCESEAEAPGTMAGCRGGAKIQDQLRFDIHLQE